MKYLIIFFFISFNIFAQTNSIKGKLSGSEGQAVQYATIQIENTSIHSLANEKGEFEITGNFTGQNYLLITHIGYEKFRIKISQLDRTKNINIVLTVKPFVSQTVFVDGNIAKEGKTPVAFSKISRNSIKANYSTQDVPEYLTTLPSVNYYSENGNGIGYNYLSIRGFDQRRISVSINGIPQNEPEDHNVYWLDFPDLLASTELIQVQRGSGSGLVGYPAIGGAVNIITSTFADKPGIELASSLGAYNTRKYSALFTSGLIENKYSIYASLSKTLSSGYRNSSWTDFNAYYISAVRYDKNMTTQLNFYGGPVADGLAYTGLPKFAVKDKNLRKMNYSYWEADDKSITYAKERRPGEIENFSQPHFELLNEFQLSDNVKLNSALFLVIGKGYFDYDGSWGDLKYFRMTKDNGFSSQMNPENVMIRAMVENNQWGWIPRVNISHKNGELIIGGEFRFHRSLHWGSLIYGEYLPSGMDESYRYYQYEGGSDIMAGYANENYRLSEKINLLLEGQVAYHQYKIFNEKYVNNDFKVNNVFFNPRIGLNYKYNNDISLYFSFSRISREPRLKDYYDAAEASGGSTPQFETNADGSFNFDKPLVHPETMNDFEAGLNYITDPISFSINAYYMLFNDEIVKQGQVDRFGQPMTGNMDRTIHRGVELTSTIKPVEGLEIILNSTLSSNYISKGVKYIKYLDPLTSTEKVRALDLSDNRISGFSDFMFSGIVRYKRWGLTLQLNAKFVDDFYSDNYGSNLARYISLYPGITSYSDNKVDDYFTTDFFASYDFQPSLFFNNIKMFIQINNIFDRLYAANAIGGEFFPAAERNFLFGIKVGL